MLTDQELQALRNMGNECESAADEIERYRYALEQIKLYHENMYGAKASTFIAYDIACKALEEA